MSISDPYQHSHYAIQTRVEEEEEQDSSDEDEDQVKSPEDEVGEIYH